MMIFKDKKIGIIVIPLLVALPLLVLSFFSGDTLVFGNTIIISAFIAIVPYFVYKYSKYAWLKAIERQFPSFVRDLADSKRSGMTIEEGINIASRSNYGKLSPEIKMMTNKLSWGIPFLKVLDMFGSHVKESPGIMESINVMKEAYKSGGDVSATLDSLARNLNMLIEAAEERKSITNQHVMISYGIFYLFLGIVFVIIYILVPMLNQGSMVGFQEVSSISNPCAGAIMPFPCGLFEATCVLFDIDTMAIACYYAALFFYVLIIQGLFSGLIAGQLGENSATAGMKHSLIMVSSALFSFLLLARTGLLIPA
jgi:flagellar protein FlaJ